MKLCTCNNCGNVYEDMNPDNKSNDYPSIDVIPLVKCYDEKCDDDDCREYSYWGCPECQHDGYLQDGVNLASLTRIDAILIQKKMGIDCTEDDSAFIKGWLRETIIQVETKDVKRQEDIQSLFPIEYGEYLDE